MRFDDLDDRHPSAVHDHGTRRSASSTTSATRYRARIDLFLKDGEPHPRLRHHALWVLHNVVAHPLLGLSPNRYSADLHELTSQWLSHRDVDLLGEVAPEPTRPWAWRFHNVVAHVAIGLLPCAPTFLLHDVSAAWMDQPGWV